MDGAKCFDCADWCGRCISAKMSKRSTIGRVASGDACSNFRPHRREAVIKN